MDKYLGNMQHATIGTYALCQQYESEHKRKEELSPLHLALLLFFLSHLLLFNCFSKVKMHNLSINVLLF